MLFLSLPFFTSSNFFRFFFLERLWLFSTSVHVNKQVHRNQKRECRLMIKANVMKSSTQQVKVCISIYSVSVLCDRQSGGTLQGPPLSNEEVQGRASSSFLLQPSWAEDEQVKERTSKCAPWEDESSQEEKLSLPWFSGTQLEFRSETLELRLFGWETGCEVISLGAMVLSLDPKPRIYFPKQREMEASLSGPVSPYRERMPSVFCKLTSLVSHFCSDSLFWCSYNVHSTSCVWCSLTYVCFTERITHITSFNMIKVNISPAVFHVSYHIFAHTHCNSRLVPLYLHTVQPQSNTLCPLCNSCDLKNVSQAVFIAFWIHQPACFFALLTVHVILWQTLCILLLLPQIPELCVHIQNPAKWGQEALCPGGSTVWNKPLSFWVQSQISYYYSCRIVGVFAGYVKIKGCFSSNMRTNC